MRQALGKYLDWYLGMHEKGALAGPLFRTAGGKMRLRPRCITGYLTKRRASCFFKVRRAA